MKKRFKILTITFLIIAFQGAAMAANPSQLIYSGNTSEKVIALTFDDCNDHDNTQAILDILQKNKVKATFFAVGTAVEADPQMFRDIAAAGHQIANHAYSHPFLSQLSYSGVWDELEYADNAIMEATGISTKPYFRPPFYDFSGVALQAAGDAGYRKAIMCTINTEDWSGIPASEITDIVVDNASPGAIVGMHAAEGLSETVYALQDIITGLKDKGYSFATVDDLLYPDLSRVTFDSQGGSAAESVIVEFNTTAAAPAEPSKEGFAFWGWYIEPECINEWDFASDKVTSDITLYAKWMGSINVLAGADRYATAAFISKASYDAADTAVLATGLNFPDALAAGPLAVQEQAPVLLTQTESISQATLDEISRLNVKKVIIMGGEDVVSPAVANTLTGMGITVERISGADRYATAVEAAKAVRAKSGVTDKIVLATGLNFPDALCIGSFAAKGGIPILLSGTDTLTETTKAAIAEFGIKEAVIAGGDDVVTQNVVDELTALGVAVTRTSGDTRYGTSADIAGKFFADSAIAVIATGLDFPDALAAVPLAAKVNAPIILVTADSVPPEIGGYLPGSAINGITVVGDNEVVGQAVKEELLNLLK